MAPTSGDRQVATGTVLFTLACGQFLMTLDSSVMNVSIATVAEDVGTTVTGIQTAITMYTLVMAALMITGGKIGQIISFKRSFAIGCVIYGVGSLTTALAPDLTVLLIGWSLLEGIGAALILPAIVALVATNFGRSERPRAYGLVAAFGAIAVAVGPLIGGLLTTYASWRWVFAGEVVVVLGILLLTRRMRGLPPDRATRLDLGGTALSGLGLVLVVFGVLRGGTWGFLNPKPGGPAWLGLSPVFWLVIAGGLVLRWFLSRNGPAGAADNRCCSTRVSWTTGCCAAASTRSCSSTCCRRACSSPCRSTCPSRSVCPRSTPACASSRCP
ncbi:MFS transporter [Catellatospora coxensis]